MVKHAAQGVLRVLLSDSGLDRLRNRDAEGPGMIRVGGEELLPDVRPVTRTRNDLGPEELHQIFPIRLLVVRDADHEDLRLQAEVVCREGQRGSPLTGPRLRREGFDALFPGVVRLRYRGVRLVRPDRREVFPLVVNLGRRFEERLEPLRAVEGRWSPQTQVRFPDLIRDRLGPGWGPLLSGELLWGEGPGSLGGDRLLRLPGAV